MQGKETFQEKFSQMNSWEIWNYRANYIEELGETWSELTSLESPIIGDVLSRTIDDGINEWWNIECVAINSFGDLDPDNWGQMKSLVNGIDDSRNAGNNFPLLEYLVQSADNSFDKSRSTYAFMMYYLAISPLFTVQDAHGEIELASDYEAQLDKTGQRDVVDAREIVIREALALNRMIFFGEYVGEEARKQAVSDSAKSFVDFIEIFKSPVEWQVYKLHLRSIFLEEFLSWNDKFASAPLVEIKRQVGMKSFTDVINDPSYIGFRKIRNGLELIEPVSKLTLSQ